MAEKKKELKIVYKPSSSVSITNEQINEAQDRVIDYIIKKLIYETGT